MDLPNVDGIMTLARRRIGLHYALLWWGRGMSPAEQSAVLLEVWAELQIGPEAQAAAAFGHALGLVTREVVP